MSKSKIRKRSFFDNIFAIKELFNLLIITLILWPLASFFFDIYDLNKLSGKIALGYAILAISYSLYQGDLAHKQIKAVKFKYRMLKDFPQLVAKNPSWDEFFHQAIVRDLQEVYDQAHPLYQEKAEKSGQKLEYLQRGIAKLEKTAEMQKSRYTHLVNEWQARLKNLVRELDRALATDISHLEKSAQLFPGFLTELLELRQKLERYKKIPNLIDQLHKQTQHYVNQKVQPVKNQREFETKAFRLMIQAPFWDEVFQATLAGEIAKTILLYGKKIQEAEKIIAEFQPKLNELRHKTRQILDQSKENKFMAKRLSNDLQILKAFAAQLQSDKLKPRDIRQIEYALAKIIAKYELSLH